MNERWKIESCFCYSTAGHKNSGEPFVTIPSGYGFWRLCKMNVPNEKQLEAETEVVEVFYGLLIDERQGREVFVTHPSKWQFYKNWSLRCLEGHDVSVHNALVKPVQIDEIKSGSESAMRAIWDKAKGQLDSLNAQLQRSGYSYSGILRRDSILPHNTVFKVLGDMMGLALPHWAHSQSGIDNRVVSELLFNLYHNASNTASLSDEKRIEGEENKETLVSISPVSPDEGQIPSPRGFL